MSDLDGFYDAGSSQQPFQHTYNLWESSAYYNINDLSARNLVSKEDSEDQCSSSFDEEKQVIRDDKNRRVISKDLLYTEQDFSHIWNMKQDEKSEPTVDLSMVSNDWTAPYWQRASGESNATATQLHTRKPKPNKIQKKLNKALSQPLNIDKAASIMAKMGWQGGALGKSGTGIVEPIAPNTVYASKTTGFGQPDPKPKPPPPPKQLRRLQKHERRKMLKSLFRKNVLLHILDFVKNDFEVEVMFEKTLTNQERKMIHDIVEEIANADIIVALNADIDESDIFNEIVTCNRYILRTQSEGEKPNRSLCVYKEAPEHLYLVTHLDLRYDPEDTDDINEQTDNEMDTDCNDHTNDLNEESNKIDKNVGDKNEIVKCNDVDEKLVANDKVNEIIVIDDDSKSLTKSNESFNDEDFNDEDFEEWLSDDDKKDSKKPADAKNAFKFVKTYYKSKVGTLKYKMKKVKVDDDDEQSTNIVSNKKMSKFCKVTSNTLDKEKNPFLKSILSVQTANNEPLTKTDLKNQILEYFDEFAKENFYTEFKFLGPFEGIEVEAINEFINNLWLFLSGGDYLNDEIVSAIKDAKCGFAIKTDPNGSALIYKTKKEESGT